eukprot:15004805-Ditylum_brightwellii.AAC.1
MPSQFVPIWAECDGTHCSGLGVVPVLFVRVNILAKFQTSMTVVVHVLSCDESARAEGSADGWGWRERIQPEYGKMHQFHHHSARYALVWHRGQCGSNSFGDSSIEPLDFPDVLIF